MNIAISDYNGAGALFSGKYSSEWAEIDSCLSSMSVYLKASDQAGKQGSYIFDPVGTNGAIKSDLINRNWSPNVKVAKEFKFLGTDVDFVKRGVVIEVQFSNYPFLYNNIIRSELFLKAGALFGGHSFEVLTVVAKSGMFPASNSTLYYEQAKRQLDALIKYNVVDVPIRLVGLFEAKGSPVSANLTTYSAARYSRTPVAHAVVTHTF